MDYLKRYSVWRNAKLSAEAIVELESIADNDLELKSRFGQELQFGTAGMRGIMGIGSNRLNRYTVRRAAQGMARWLSVSALPQKTAIAYDSRHNSKEFAEICAVAFAEKGIHAYIFDRLAPTPMLSFAVRELGCGCGIVISASHNSGEYNGVKCYGPDGCQMTDEPARLVMEQIVSVQYFEPEQGDFATYMRDNLISYIPDDLWERYYAAVLGESINPGMISDAGINVVYTPLCGTGNEPVREILKRLRANVTIVACQENPDGDFKTCEYPNPEADAALQESYKVANKGSCDVILATDPDCDRVAIAVPDGNGYKKLSGNELGCLLLEYVLRERSIKGDLPVDPIVVKSIVSTPLADRIAKEYGVKMRSVLTGFKYIGGEILELELKHQENRFVFGFEESCGYLKGTYARDKDAVVASMLVCELVASLKLRGKCILDAVREMYDNYGYFLSNVESMELTGPDAMERASNLMAELRTKLPESIGGAPLTAVRDYRVGFETNMTNNERVPINLPSSNVLEFVLGEKGSVIVRPSGTEPKVKYYYTAVGTTANESQELLRSIKQQMHQQ